MLANFAAHVILSIVLAAWRWRTERRLRASARRRARAADRFLRALESLPTRKPER
jgi:hypothetical protein